MASEGLYVRFMMAPMDLLPDEVAAPWEHGVPGTIRFERDAIYINGKTRMSMVGDFMTMGLAQPLMKRAFAANREEIVPVRSLHRVTLGQRNNKGVLVVALHERLDDGSSQVHSLLFGWGGPKDGADRALESVRAVVPSNLIFYMNEGVAVPVTPADWYPDPVGAHELRYYDGTSWTAHVSNDGVQSAHSLPAEADSAFLD